MYLINKTNLVNLKGLDMDEKLVKERLARLNQWNRGEVASPFKMLLYPTNVCNLQCIFCNGTYHRRSKKFDYDSELTISDFERIVSEGLEMGVKQWWIQGAGEPMSVPRTTMRIAEMIKGSNNKTEGMIVTNGTLFKERDIERLVELGFDRIIFSIDAPDYETNDYLRGAKGAFDKSVGNIKLFKEFKTKNNAENPEIYINAVLTSKIWNKIDNFLSLCSENAVDKLVLNPLRLQGEVRESLENEFTENLALTKEQKIHISKNLPKFFEMSKKLGVELEINGIEEGYEPYEKEYNKIEKEPIVSNSLISSLCFEPFTTILIGPMGEVGCCCGDEYERSPLNIRGKSLKEVWNSDYLSSIRKKMIENISMRGCFSCGFQKMTETLRSEFEKFSN